MVALLAAKLLDLMAQTFFGLSNWYFVYTLDVLPCLASAAWSVSVALRGGTSVSLNSLLLAQSTKRDGCAHVANEPSRVSCGIQYKHWV